MTLKNSQMKSVSYKSYIESHTFIFNWCNEGLCVRIRKFNKVNSAVNIWKHWQSLASINDRILKESLDTATQLILRISVTCFVAGYFCRTFRTNFCILRHFWTVQFLPSLKEIQKVFQAIFWVLQRSYLKAYFGWQWTQI